ncbi:GntR family transcriptional regulator [Pasteurellaceae bacterium Orientalotternb1]|nr:GntR family transcriptional regulator [Pasteurellaceae bacterium Orientalotternb1]
MEKLTKKAASLALQERIKRLIIDRKMKSGDLMPTENELIDLFGVSRSSLREAIKSLEALNIIEIRHGIGTFVGTSSLTPMISGLTFYAQLRLQENLKSILDILDIREILQYGFASLALEKIQQAEVDELQQLVKVIEEQAQQGEFSIQEEHQIHLLIYHAIQNHLLTQYLDAFWQIYQQVKDDLPPLQVTPQEQAIQYRELVDAVEARDLERLQRAILYYFQTIRKSLVL